MGTSHGVFVVTHGRTPSTDTTCRFCCCSKAAQILLQTSTAQLQKAVLNLMVSTNQNIDFLSCYLATAERPWTSDCSMENTEFCPRFSRCWFQALEKQTIVCFPGHLSLSFVLLSLEMARKVVKDLKYSSLSNQNFFDELTM